MKRNKGILLFILLIVFLVFAEKLILFFSPVVSVKNLEDTSISQTVNHPSAISTLIIEKPETKYNSIKSKDLENINIFQTVNYSSTSSAISAMVIGESRVKHNNITRKNIIFHRPTLLDRDRKYCVRIPNKDPLQVPPEWEHRCPEKPVVTVMQYGRLGNQLWEYISVWTLAKITGREPFVPSCIIQTLEDVFKNLPEVLPLKYIENCPIRYHYLISAFNIEEREGSIVLPFLAQLPHYVMPHLKEILPLFKFHDHLVERSQQILRTASEGVRDTVYISVHARRTDFIFVLRLIFLKSFVPADFFLRHMNYFRKKYSRVLFLILSDDPEWCERELIANDTVVVKGNSPEQDLSLLASCNHSILDYGTFAMWGAMFAGGETFVYKLGGLEEPIVNMMPNWYSVS